MKGRKAQNQITMLRKEDDTTIINQETITKEAVDFYKNLLGQTTHQMPIARQEIIRAGPLLQRTQQLTLIKNFTKKDVLKALNSIEDNKAPGEDEFNSYFYKQAWPIVGEEVIEVVLHFFNTNEMYGPINRTIVTLIPKVKHLSSIKEYRLISCCTILYKIISKMFTKMFTSRLQAVLKSLIDLS